MKENLISLLSELEKREHITIMMAAVTGSHSFGLSSSSSDFDVRFIYVQNEVKTYLSISKPVDSIQLVEGSLDLVGWDLFKASRLMLKSNPSVYELVTSPIQLIDEPTYRRNMLSLMNVAYSKKVLGHHYLRMIKSNIQRLAEEKDTEIKTFKTWVQVYRSYLTLHYLIQKKSLPPIDVWELLESVVLEEDMKKRMTTIFMAKQSEDFPKLASEENLKVLKGTFPFLEENVTKLPVGRDMEKELNHINWSILKGEIVKWDI
ncbi:DNA polymerase beta superfamily protein [Peribacillus sp.]|uniref:DNA polymerase beta superfamily protein n=1 Tax=Peribacillus sp. TaxID=2675267 RepID=UPI00388E3A09